MLMKRYTLSIIVFHHYFYECKRCHNEFEKNYRIPELYLSNEFYVFYRQNIHSFSNFDQCLFLLLFKLIHKVRVLLFLFNYNFKVESQVVFIGIMVKRQYRLLSRDFFKLQSLIRTVMQKLMDVFSLHEALNKPTSLRLNLSLLQFIHQP